MLFIGVKLDGRIVIRLISNGLGKETREELVTEEGNGTL